MKSFVLLELIVKIIWEMKNQNEAIYAIEQISLKRARIVLDNHPQKKGIKSFMRVPFKMSRFGWVQMI